MEANTNTDTEEMIQPDLLLEATDKEKAFSGGYAEDPVWEHVEMRIERAFQYGGTVRLHAGKAGHERSQGFVSIEFLAMESLPGKYRLIFSPEIKSLGEKTKLCEWWEPGDAPFRGTMRFGDDEWDVRTVCTDVLVAKNLFKDFFDHRRLTETVKSQMRSVWDRKPR